MSWEPCTVLIIKFVSIVVCLVVLSPSSLYLDLDYWSTSTLTSSVCDETDTPATGGGLFEKIIHTLGIALASFIFCGVLLYHQKERREQEAVMPIQGAAEFVVDGSIPLPPPTLRNNLSLEAKLTQLLSKLRQFELEVAASKCFPVPPAPMDTSACQQVM